MTHHEKVAAWLARFDSPDLDIASVLCDQHAAEAVAFTFVDPDQLTFTNLTYGQMGDQSRRLAAALRDRGVCEGDRIPVLMGKRPELVVTLMALWRLGAVHVPLFTAFAAGAIEVRVTGSQAALVITDASQKDKLVELDVATLDVDSEWGALISCEPLVESVSIGGDGAWVQLFTSGTTGKPKGVEVPGRALASFSAYMHYGLDVAAEDVYWNAADPGWAYGLYYGVIGPLATGRPNLLATGQFTPASTARILSAFGVTNFAGAPTVYRALATLDATTLPTLRRASSAGEPLTPDVIDWARRALGVEVRDHYGQTELGMVIANGWEETVLAPLRPGSMGRALPGFSATIRDDQIALDVQHSPLLWFRGYTNAPQQSAERFSSDGRWYLTADSGRIDDDGYVYFASRDDDVILAAGYRIGPFEVESVIATHPAVAEVAVVGRRDPQGIRGEQVEAFVVPTAGADTTTLAEELQALVRNTYSKHAYPRVVHVVDSLPKTPSGKVQRFLLRESSTDILRSSAHRIAGKN